MPETDNAVHPSGPEMAAVRKVLNRIAGYGEHDPVPDDILTVAAQAAERYEELTTTVERLEGRIDALEGRAPSPSKQEYEELDKEDKAIIVRQKLRSIAENSGGRSAMDYKDVMKVFDGQPSPGHAYDIMEVAAEVEGFDYGEGPGGTKRLTVNTEDVNVDAGVHAVNNGRVEKEA